MFSGLKKWLLIGIGGLITLGSIFLYIIGLGRKVERADNIEEGIKNDTTFDQHIQAGHEAGNVARHDAAVGGLPKPSTQPDPNDRAQRRKGG